MKFLSDLLPVLLFFFTYKWGQANEHDAYLVAQHMLRTFIVDGTVPPGQAPVLLATAVVILTSVMQLLWVRAHGRNASPTQWIGLAIVLVFGAATIWFHNDVFIKWKPSVLYWSFALVLLAGKLFFGRNLIRSLMGSQLSLPDGVWLRLLQAWVGFLTLMGTINIVVVYSVPTDIWVNFKLFGMTGLLILFSFAIGIWLLPYMKDLPGAKKTSVEKADESRQLGG